MGQTFNRGLEEEKGIKWIVGQSLKGISMCLKFWNAIYLHFKV